MSDPFIGQIQMFGFNFAPRGWAHCNGQLLPISQNTALFSLLGTTYGGDGRTTFGLPGLRSRSAVHVGQGAGLDTITWGERGGGYQHTLTTQQLPAHSHAPDATTGAADASSPSGNVPAVAEDGNRNPLDVYSTATPDTTMGATANTGGGQAFNTRNPFLGVYHCIALTGIFPSRN